MRIIVDGMGGDHAPAEVVKGCVEATKFTEHTIILIGDETLLHKELDKYPKAKKRIQVVHASEVITMEDAPVRAIRSKKDSSMVKGLNMVKNGEGDIFISAGNSGALMAGGIFILGRIRGVERPAIAATYPILGKGVCLLVDSGANAECRANNLLEFAVMGNIYMERVLGKSNPRVGLVNIGVEETKGTAMLQSAYQLLKNNNGLNFIGNVEAREVPLGGCDVAVCDGFVGNILLKTTEGMGKSVSALLKARLMETLRSKMGALVLAPQLAAIKKEFDYSEYGGAPILGVRGAVVKMHGSSKANAVKNTILKAIPYAEQGVVATMEEAIARIEEDTCVE
ncbi:MAG: phosphate acyltransferase PlsX [Clostridiales bacterium]|nr:phosphate acyltransferase PlsX [Clostridiales bacterium]